MKTKILLTLLCLSALIGAACNQQNQTGNTAVLKSDPHAGMNHNAATLGSNHQGMDHGAMDHSAMQSAPEAAAAPYDLQFLDTMIAHHQAAVEMARPAETKAQHAELKTLAKNISAEQEKQIAQMKKWREQWFAGQPAALNMEMAGMNDSMKDMDMKKLGSLGGGKFDGEFIKQMIPHHEGAVTMAQEALQKSQKEEIKTLANQIVKAQKAEIELMRGWEEKWSK